MSHARSYVGSALLGAGLVFLYLGERLVDPGTPRVVISGVGVLLALIAVALRLARVGKVSVDRQSVERALLGLTCIAVAALAIYFAQSDAFSKWGQPLPQSSPKLAGVLAVLWPALLIAAVLPIFFIELAYASMTRAPVVELPRVRDAMLSGLGLAGALVFCFTAVYVATERDTKWDLSYFRTARPGEATRKIVRALDEPVQVTLFFPPANEVAEQVVSYFDDLKKESPKLEVTLLDQAIDPAKAREMQVSNNGVVVIARGERREQLTPGTELERARERLRNLDQEVQKRLLTVARSRKTLYFVSGHGERTEDAEGVDGKRAAIALLKTELRAQNHELRSLTAAEGLGSEIPKDAAAVVIIGPTSALQAPEIASLKTYFQGGGRLLIALDPEAKLDFKDLLAPFGVTFQPVVLANDVAYARKSYQPSDKAIIGTNIYSSHPSVTSLSRAEFPIFFLEAGKVEAAAQPTPELSVDLAVRAHPATWQDTNGNYTFDAPGEARMEYGLVAAVTQRSKAGAKPGEKPADEGRALILGDSDALADEVFAGSRGNAVFAIDGFKWLVGDEAISGATNVEQDVPVTRTKKKDELIFYSTIFLAPAAVVLAGFLTSRRRGRTRARPTMVKEGGR